VITRLPSGWAVLGDPQITDGYCLLLPDPVIADDPAVHARFVTRLSSWIENG